MLTITQASLYDDVLHRVMCLCRDNGGDFSYSPLHHYLLLVFLTKVRYLLTNIPFDEKNTEYYFFLDDNLNVKNIVYDTKGKKKEAAFSCRRDGCFYDLLRECDVYDAEDELREGRENFINSETFLYESSLWSTEVYCFQDDYTLDHQIISGVPGSEKFLEELQAIEDCTGDWTKEKAGAIDQLVRWSDYSETGLSSMVLSNENSLEVYVVESSAPQFVHDILASKETELSLKEQEFMLLWDSNILPFTSYWGDVTCSYNGKNAWIEAIGTCNQCDNSPQNFSVSLVFYYFQKLTEELYYLYCGCSETEVA